MYPRSAPPQAGRLACGLLRALTLAAALVAALALPGRILAQAPAGALYTHSFSSKAGWGTHPQTVAFSGGIMTVDLSSIQGANVTRAIFYPHLDRLSRAIWPSFDNNAMLGGFNVFDSANQPIPLRGPRFVSVDLTAQVRAALATGRLSLRLQHPGWSDFTLALSVTCDRPLGAALPAVTGVAASFRNGDTMVTFNEVDSPLTDANSTWGAFTAAFASLDATREVRYRIYRSTTPLAAPADLASATLVDEIPPLSCWDYLYFGLTDPGDSTIVPRYPVADLTLAAPGTGIYVKRFRGAAPQNAYYFVSRMVNGQEDLSTLAAGANATAAVAESTGPGMVLERARNTDVSFYYIDHATQHYYVRWEAPPTCTLPSTPFDYLVAEPPATARVSPAPVSLALHCWGGTLNGGYLWWYDAAKGAIHVSTNQLPYDWWTAYNENLGTLKPLAEGSVQPFTQARVLSFLYDFVDLTFHIDRSKILLHGMSMGGSGASMWGIRSGHIFSGIISMVGVHIPAETPGFVSSFEGVFGSRALKCRYDNSILQRFGYPLVSAADNVSVWDYWDNDLWLRTHPSTETPWITYANGQNDDAIGWPQAWDMTRALIDTRRGFTFVWGQSGHGQRPAELGGFAGGNSTLQFRSDQFVPAATNCSLDGDLGTTPAASALSGEINQYLTWDTATVAETSTSLSFRLALSSSAPAATATADITPHRLQVFHPAAGATCTWQALSATGLPLGSGSVTVGSDGLLTLPSVTIPRIPAYAAVTVTASLPTDHDYAGWRALNFSGADLASDAISGPAADPDGAGVTNFQRYAHGLAARGPVAAPVTLGSVSSGGQRYLTLSFDRRAIATDLRYTVESSTDLASWAPVPGLTYAAGTPARVTAQDTVATSGPGAARRFLRLRITQP